MYEVKTEYEREVESFMAAPSLAIECARVGVAAAKEACRRMKLRA